MKNFGQAAVPKQTFGEVTQLLENFREGDQEAFGRLFSLVYQELRRLAQAQLRSERTGDSMVATALVHEVFLRLVGQPATDWSGRERFFGIASRAMRQILIERARRRNARKRGGEQPHTTLSDAKTAVELNLEDLLALDGALDRLEAVDLRLRKVVEYRFFCGLSEHEIAALLGVSTRSVERDWVAARAWLFRELHPEAVKPDR
jgi:RNA polymerase sigma factor (TIGR02999 family)